jgi:hypothetical protein
MTCFHRLTAVAEYFWRTVADTKVCDDIYMRPLGYDWGRPENTPTIMVSLKLHGMLGSANHIAT